MEEGDRHEYRARADEELNPAINKGKGRCKLSLDNYYRFLDSGDYNLLSHRHLNQVFSIHGFAQPRRGTRHQLVEMLKTIEPKDFSRSTLDESIQPAPMSLSDVVKDLEHLAWQTCPVVSVRSIDSTQGNSTACTCNSKKLLKPGKKTTKKKKTGVASKPKSYGQSCITAGDGVSMDEQKVYETAMTTGTSCSSTVMAQEMPSPGSKRKRKVNKKSLAYLLSGEMPNLSKELGVFPSN